MTNNQLAALSEQQGRLKQAERLWAKAIPEAETREQREYCENRKRFCQIWSART